MRYLFSLVLSLVLIPAVVWAADDAPIEELVENAVKAVKTTNYEARMKYYQQHRREEEQTLHIYHVAPELYHVQQMTQNVHGEWVYQDASYFIENGVELVLIRRNNNKVMAVEQMPQRIYFLNDSLTIKLLTDLAKHPGTELLNGNVGDRKVHILRQPVSQQKPYMITVGLDVDTYFPVFLLLNDSKDKATLYYEMINIEYYDQGELDPELFMIPDVSQDKHKRAPRVNQVYPSEAMDDVDSTAYSLGSKQASESWSKSAKAADAESEMAEESQESELPLYPTWLPRDYFLEGIRLHNYASNSAKDVEETLVYQYEIIGPYKGAQLSIFQAKADDLDFSVESLMSQKGSGFIVSQHDDWVVIVFGELENDILLKIVDGLETREAEVKSLLENTLARDLLYENALGGG